MISPLKILIIARSIIIKDHKILILKRHAKENHGADCWEFPGGKLEAQEDYFTALKREVLEETGLQIEPINRMVHIDSEIFKSGKYIDYVYIELCSISYIVSGNVVISSEHSEFKWIALENISQYDLTEEASIVFKDAYENILKALDLS